MITLDQKSLRILDKAISFRIQQNDGELPNVDEFIDSLFARYNSSTETGKITKMPMPNYFTYKIDGWILHFYNSEGDDLTQFVKKHQVVDVENMMRETLKSRFKIIEAKLKQQSDKTYGDVLFGTERGLYEPDTDPEGRLYRKFKNYVDDNQKIDQQAKQEIAAILKNNEYVDIFSPPKTGTEIYRGMSVTRPELEKLLSPEEITTLEKEKTKGLKSLSNPIIFTPRDEISSWSKQKRVADNFAKDNMNIKHRRIYSVVLISTITDSDKTNFLDVSGWYDEIGGYEAEQEVVAFDKVVITKIEYSLAYERIEI